MSDSNLENTQPSRPTEDLEKTRVSKARAENSNLEVTQPVVPPSSESNPPVAEWRPPLSEPDTTPPSRSGRPRRWPWVLGGLVLIFLCGALGGFLGYRAALNLRAQVNAEEVARVATEQFMLALQEQTAGKYDLALKRYEYVISLDPNFPGVQEKLTEVMMAIALAQTPTVTLPVATPTLTPTPDTRAEEEIFNNARQLLANKEWSKAIEVLDTLRNKNIAYRTVEVDGMYYIALRFRGLAKINAGALEEGLYDLALVERFASPLDVDAEGVRTWARMYIAGASYWGVRWDQVIHYFSQIYPYYPAMRDATGMTAIERYRVALIKYGDQLASAGKYCEAYEQYQASYQVGPDSALDPTVTAVFTLCHPATATPQPTVPLTPTPTVETVVPTVETPAPTQETPTEAPSPTP
ncbi:hypothetical protein ATHL_02148 [Anaerolinea thermolimosa]|uniref:tetratricopeptide repeat protein n=1 Tax=Anaerolinea thermolimosa TaxID=229919 RepID=UPI0007844EA2|nr:tetratricopeptide repeat protein [Anaerolinea thermolimosa]GAP07278.1 hypothetical protein ATHL_02148 [Anaerolinea thermolimosa]